MTLPDYASYDALGLAELVHKREVTPRELIEEAIRRIERHNPVLNAIVHELYDRAREAADRMANRSTGPFAGVPLLLKDLMGDLRGVPTCYASRFMLGHEAPFDSELVVRLQAAARAAARPRPWPPGSSRSPTRTTAGARFASLPRAVGWWVSSPPAAAIPWVHSSAMPSAAWSPSTS